MNDPTAATEDVTPPPALTEVGRLRAQVEQLTEDVKRSEELAKLGARCFRDHHDGQIAEGRAVIEGHRFALSVALGLGTGAPWDAIHERVKELAAEPAASAVVSPPTDRAFLLRVADHLARCADQLWPGADSVMHADADQLRRLAVEAHDTGTQQPERCTCDHARAMHTGPTLFCAVPGCECAQYAGAQQQPETEAPPADRPAVLREIATTLDQLAETDVIRKRRSLATARRLLAVELRRMADEPAPVAQQHAAEEPGPWVVQKICCGRDDGTPEFATWEAADSFRETYIDSARVAGHERSAIVRRKDATTPEQQAAAADGEETPSRAVLLELVRDFLDPDPCSFDHHGYCQAHGYLGGEPGSCPHGRARKLIPGIDEDTAP